LLLPVASLSCCFLELLRADDSALRRWGAIGLLALDANAAPATAHLRSALNDPAPDVRMTAAEALCNLGRADDAVPALIKLLAHNDFIVRHETILALCRIGPAAKAALPHLDKARAPGAQHTGLWTSDNVVAAMARACLSATPKTTCKTRQKYIP
jgi:hypothetical protein